jgi:histidinol-phosphate aminotransferase
LKVLRSEIVKVGFYPDPRCTQIKKAIAKYLGVKTENLCIGNGSDELIDLICKAFLSPRERVLIPVPTFALYELCAQIYGGSPVYCALPRFQWDERLLLRKSRNAKVVFLGRPNNPTGNMVDIATVKRLSKTARLLVVDEAYGEFAETSIATVAAESRNIVVLKTFSKAFGLAGLRIGYAVGPPTLIRVLEELRTPFNVNRLAQKAAVAALKDLKYLRKIVRAIKTQREWLSSKLQKLDLEVIPSRANFIMVGLERWGIDARTLTDVLVERKILVRDLSGFRGAGDKYVRITVGTPAQNKKLIKALKEVRLSYGGN